MSIRAYYSKALYAKANRLQVPQIRTGPNRKKSSSASFVSISSDFIRKVQDMEDTVLIPTKLMDVEVTECEGLPPLVMLNGNSNLFECFQLIK